MTGPLSWLTLLPVVHGRRKKGGKNEKEIGGEKGEKGGRREGEREKETEREREKQGGKGNRWRQRQGRGEEEAGSQLVDGCTLWVIFLGSPNSKDWFLMLAFSFSLLATSIGWD